MLGIGTRIVLLENIYIMTKNNKYYLEFMSLILQVQELFILNQQEGGGTYIYSGEVKNSLDMYIYIYIYILVGSYNVYYLSLFVNPQLKEELTDIEWITLWVDMQLMSGQLVI